MNYYVNLFWAGAAFAVAWQLLQMIVNQSGDPRELGEYGLLSVIAIYMVANWGRKGGQSHKMKMLDHIFDPTHLLLVVWIVIAIEYRESAQLAWASFAMLFWVGLGHFCRVKDNNTGYQPAERVMLGLFMWTASAGVFAWSFVEWHNRMPLLDLPPAEVGAVAAMMAAVLCVWFLFLWLGDTNASVDQA